MLSEKEKALIRDSWRLVVPIAETAADLFYRRLFELKPQYKALFPPEMAGQKRKLLAMLSFVVTAIDYPDAAWRESVAAESDLMLILLALGRRHSDLYRVPDEAYESVGEALLWTLDYGLGKKFTLEVRDAWAHVYKLVSLTMKMGRLSVPEQPAVTASMATIFGADGKPKVNGREVRP